MKLGSQLSLPPFPQHFSRLFSPFFVSLLAALRFDHHHFAWRVPADWKWRLCSRTVWAEAGEGGQSNIEVYVIIVLNGRAGRGNGRTWAGKTQMKWFEIADAVKDVCILYFLQLISLNYNRKFEIIIYDWRYKLNWNWIKVKIFTRIYARFQHNKHTYIDGNKAKNLKIP